MKPKNGGKPFEDGGSELWTGLRMSCFLGITDRQLRSLVEQHVITPTLVKSGGRNVRRYEPISVNTAYREYSIQNALKRRQAHSLPQPEAEDMTLRLKRLQVAVRKEQAEKLRLQNQLNRGELLPRSEVMDDLRGFLIPLKRFVMSIPSRVVGMLSGIIDPLEVRRVSSQLTVECNDNLRNFVLAGELLETETTETKTDDE